MAQGLVVLVGAGMWLGLVLVVPLGWGHGRARSGLLELECGSVDHEEVGGTRSQ